METRTDQGNHWWELRACAYYNSFDKPKIQYQEIATYQAFSFDTLKTYPLKTVFSIPTNEIFLLGVLNSQAAWDFMGHVCAKLQGGAYLMQTSHIATVPIPTPNARDKSAIEELVATCLSKKGVDCGDEEAEINARVAKLYGL